MKKAILFYLVLFASAGSYTANAQNWFIGNWEGAGIQVDNLTWTIKLTVRSLDQVKVDYDDLVCIGHWTFVKTENDVIYYTEYIDKNTGGCVPVCDAIVERLGKDRIRLTFIVASYHVSEPFAIATLHRTDVKK